MINGVKAAYALKGNQVRILCNPVAVSVERFPLFATGLSAREGGETRRSASQKTCLDTFCRRNLRGQSRRVDFASLIFLQFVGVACSGGRFLYFAGNIQKVIHDNDIIEKITAEIIAALILLTLADCGDWNRQDGSASAS